eukprot:CAMPEP_0198336622 /NCGR_PEP_ID=MMETSP1450-20131203/21095_1 /TAXON_ID=753684 ORGANISM="Madagascaria erythrocladiodes, Strain CCMP3234" /NCGR_SAMPLE_ID=MMETSP1450 /ASSEMBLY_ACC=CAM_ASM_001115 /LENGTH=378 /DNA_ID=CAMNT_0044041375 /DNA_START=150 /DNA_END=1286 /DNA_ORIENTATION=+
MAEVIGNNGLCGGISGVLAGSMYQLVLVPVVNLAFTALVTAAVAKALHCRFGALERIYNHVKFKISASRKPFAALGAIRRGQKIDSEPSYQSDAEKRGRRKVSLVTAIVMLAALGAVFEFSLDLLSRVTEDGIRAEYDFDVTFTKKNQRDLQAIQFTEFPFENVELSAAAVVNVQQITFGIATSADDRGIRNSVWIDSFSDDTNSLSVHFNDAKEFNVPGAQSTAIFGYREISQNSSSTGIRGESLPMRFNVTKYAIEAVTEVATKRGLTHSIVQAPNSTERVLIIPGIVGNESLLDRPWTKVDLIGIWSELADGFPRRSVVTVRLGSTTELNIGTCSRLLVGWVPYAVSLLLAAAISSVLFATSRGDAMEEILGEAE